MLLLRDRHYLYRKTLATCFFPASLLLAIRLIATISPRSNYTYQFLCISLAEPLQRRPCLSYQGVRNLRASFWSFEAGYRKTLVRVLFQLLLFFMILGVAFAKVPSWLFAIQLSVVPLGRVFIYTWLCEWGSTFDVLFGKLYLIFSLFGNLQISIHDYKHQEQRSIAYNSQLFPQRSQKLLKD